jgi:membrane protease YdiL (CAAX protease family)
MAPATAAAGAATGAGGVGATSTAPATEGASLLESLIAGGLLAWFVIALVALFHIGFFSSKALRGAPQRTAAGLLPVAFATVLLYLVLAGIAITAGLKLNLFSEEALGRKPAATAPATVPDTQAATASAPAVDETALSPEQQERRSVEQMRVQTLGIGTELLACALALGLVHVLTVGGLRGFGLAPDKIGWGVALGLLAYVILFPILYVDNILVSWLYMAAGHAPTVHETVKDIESTPDFNVRLIFALVAGIGAPIAEEIFFRGFLQTAFIQKFWGFVPQFPPDRNYVPPVYQRWAAILLCSVLFCLMHSIDHMPILFVLSVGLGYIYERTGNLWASIVLHALFNWATLVQLLWS